MRYLAAPEDIHWQHWAMLRTVVQANSAALQDSAIRSSWQSQVSKALSESVLDHWPTPNNFLCQTINVDENIQLWTAADPARHPLNSEGSIIILRFSDSGNHLRSSWVEALRLLNLYQFLPHCYFVTNDNLEEVLDLQIPSTFISHSSQPEQPQAWDEIRDLADERLLTAIDQMQQENWPLPEVGYELLDKQGSMAELWWPNAQIAVVIENSDQQAFMAIGCKALLIEEFLQLIDEIGNQLLGGK